MCVALVLFLLSCTLSRDSLQLVVPLGHHLRLREVPLHPRNDGLAAGAIEAVVTRVERHLAEPKVVAERHDEL